MDLAGLWLAPFPVPDCGWCSSNEIQQCYSGLAATHGTLYQFVVYNWFEDLHCLPDRLWRILPHWTRWVSHYKGELPAWVTPVWHTFFFKWMTRVLKCYSRQIVNWVSICPSEWSYVIQKRRHKHSAVILFCESLVAPSESFSHDFPSCLSSLTVFFVFCLSSMAFYKLLSK